MSIVRAVLLPVAAALLVVVAALGPSPSEDDGARRPSLVTLKQSSYACPAGSVIRVSAGQLSAGGVAQGRSVPDRADVPALGSPTTWRSTIVDAPGVVVDQDGAGSGPVGFFSGTAPAAGGGGLVVGPCPGVVDEAWLLGLGSGSKHQSTLVLTNLGESPAIADLTLWGPQGRIDAVGAEGLVVAPLTTTRVRLADLAAGEAEVALRVHRRRGALSAIVNDSSTGVFKGTEPISATTAPARDQVLGGLVEGVTGRTLLVVNPGNATARVDVQVIGEKATFAPEGFSDLQVPGGTLAVLEVPRSAGSGRQALRVTSDQPVAASVRMSPTDVDFAYAESTPPLAGPAVVPVDTGGDAAAPELVVSAPGADASVRLTAHDAAMGTLGTLDVAVPAGTTQRVDLAAAATLGVPGVAYVVVEPKGEVVAAATYRRGKGISSLSLLAAPVRVASPQVRPVD